ncbi:MAG: hypothetical protein WCA20_33520 [Candidatus Sulfotelmatobacter sp.]
MILGWPYERLIAVNGKPLTPDEQADEQRKLDAVTSADTSRHRRERDGSPNMKKIASVTIC